MKTILCITLALAFFILFAGCEKTKVPPPPETQTFQKPVVSYDDMPNFESIRSELDTLLDRPDLGTPPEELIEERIGQVNEKLAKCDSESEKPKCEKTEIANLNLMMGDLLFDKGQFEPAATQYQKAVIDYFQAFETEKIQQDKNMKINAEQLSVQGETAHLLAGGAFLDALFSVNAYAQFSSMIRTERRMAQAYKNLDNQKEAAAAMSRANLGLDRMIEFRKTYEKRKRELLALEKGLGKDFKNYAAHVASWESQLVIQPL